MNPWPILSSEDAFRHRWYHLRRDMVRLPDGTTDAYFVSVRPEVAMVVPVDRMGRAILVRLYKHAVQTTSLEFPGGTFRDEPPDVAARRELAEETGYSAGRLVPLGKCFDDASRNTNSVHMFLGLDCEPTAQQALDSGERAGGLEVMTLALDDLIAALDDGRIENMSSLLAGYRAVKALRCL
jgi:8-oxo-dGTP pyrophosphatase MutT (NUDIX family)